MITDGEGGVTRVGTGYCYQCGCDHPYQRWPCRDPQPWPWDRWAADPIYVTVDGWGRRVS